VLETYNHALKYNQIRYRLQMHNVKIHPSLSGELFSYKYYENLLIIFHYTELDFFYFGTITEGIKPFRLARLANFLSSKEATLVQSL